MASPQGAQKPLLVVDVRHLNNPEYTGISHYTFEVLRALKQSGYTNNLLLFTAGKPFPLPRELRAFQRFHLHKSNRFLSLLFFFKLKTIESFISQPVEAIWLPNINTLYTKKPVLLTIHDTSFVHFPHFFSLLARLRTSLSRSAQLVRGATKRITVSRTSKAHIAKTFALDPGSITEIPLAVTNDFQSTQQPGDEAILRNYGVTKPYFFSLCTLEPRKNLESVLEAYERIKEPKPALVLAGSAGWKTTLGTTTHHIGYIKEKDRPALLRGAVALLLPSYYEGFGLPVLESIACGTPVITTPTGALPELAHPLVTFVPPLRIDALLRAMQTAIHAPKPTGNELKFTPRTWDEVAKETLDVLKPFLS